MAKYRPGCEANSGKVRTSSNSITSGQNSTMDETFGLQASKLIDFRFKLYVVFVCSVILRLNAFDCSSGMLNGRMNFVVKQSMYSKWALIGLIPSSSE